MGDDREFEGESLEEALTRASEFLGRALQEADYAVLQEGRRGFLGVGSRGVRIRVHVADERASVPDQGEAPAHGDDARQIEEFLQRFAASSPFEIDFQVTPDSSGLRIELGGRDRDLFLARRGEGLNALQTVLGRIVSQMGSAREVILDSGDFRRSREEELAEIAQLMAEKVKKLGEPQSLSPMNPYDRRLVHLALKDDPAVETHSEGDGFLKSVKIFPRRG
jgi:spoIIIJ-associated protein